MAKGKPDIWYPRKAAKYVAGAMQLSMEEDCFLTRLMDQYWILQGPLPVDESRLQNLTRTNRAQFNRCKWVLNHYFALEGQVWHHAELDEDLAEARERTRIAQENGQKGGRPPRYPHGTPEKPAGLPGSEPGNNPAGYPAGTQRGAQEESSSPLPLSGREKPNTPSAPPPGAPMDPAKRKLWDELLAEFRLKPVIASEFTRYLAVVNALYAKGANPGDIADRARRYRAGWKVECTPEALVKWWDRFAPPPAAQTRPETPAEREAREAREKDLQEWLAMPPAERQAVARACVEDALSRLAK